LTRARYRFMLSPGLSGCCQPTRNCSKQLLRVGVLRASVDVV
jgi:hypothetical protein